MIDCACASLSFWSVSKYETTLRPSTTSRSSVRLMVRSFDSVGSKRRSLTFPNVTRSSLSSAIAARVGRSRNTTRSRMKSNSSDIGRSARNSRASVVRICVRSLLRSFSSSSTAMARFVACESVSMAMNCEVVSSEWKTTSLSPRAMRSPGRSSAVSTSFTPLSVVPFTLPQSRTNQVPRSLRISAWRRERKRSLIGIVQSEARPSVMFSAGSVTCCGESPG